jgi:hypothetical protein
MINVDVFDRTPMFPGDRRELLLSGDGPFKVTNSCFVDTPPPAGFRPCSACSSVVVQAGTPHYIVAEQSFWTGKEGEIEITIVDAVGDNLSIRMNVLPDNRNQPIFASA